MGRNIRGTNNGYSKATHQTQPSNVVIHNTKPVAQQPSLVSNIAATATGVIAGNYISNKLFNNNNRKGPIRSFVSKLSNRIVFAFHLIFNTNIQSHNNKKNYKNITEV